MMLELHIGRMKLAQHVCGPRNVPQIPAKYPALICAQKDKPFTNKLLQGRQGQHYVSAKPLRMGLILNSALETYLGRLWITTALGVDSNLHFLRNGRGQCKIAEEMPD